MHVEEVFRSFRRCVNCFDCPSCQHTLSTRATTLTTAVTGVSTAPESPQGQQAGTPTSAPKKVYYLACGFCRWTSRDVGLEDQPVGELTFYLVLTEKMCNIFSTVCITCSLVSQKVNLHF